MTPFLRPITTTLPLTMLNTFFTAENHGAAIVVVTFGYVCYFYIEHEGQPGY